MLKVNNNQVKPSQFGKDQARDIFLPKYQGETIRWSVQQMPENGEENLHPVGIGSENWLAMQLEERQHLLAAHRFLTRAANYRLRT